MVTLDLPHHIGRIQSDQEGPLNPKGPVHFYHTSTAHTCNPWPSLILHLAVPDCQASLHFSLTLSVQLTHCSSHFSAPFLVFPFSLRLVVLSSSVFSSRSPSFQCAFVFLSFKDQKPMF